MADIRYTAINKILTNNGLAFCGPEVYETTYSDNYTGDTWFYEDDPPSYPYNKVVTFTLSGIDCKAAFMEAATNIGLECTLFRLVNGTRFYVTVSFLSGTELNWIIWGERGNNIYQLGQGANIYTRAVKIYCGLAYFEDSSGHKYNTFYIASEDYNGYNRHILGLRFLSPGNLSNWPGYQEKWDVLLNNQPLNVDDPYITQPDGQGPGGYGPGTYTSDEDLPPALPALSAAQCGFVSLWNPTIAELKNLATYIWNDSWWVNQWHHIVANPLDVILSLGMIPFAPATSDTKAEVVFGSGGSSGVECYKITDQMYIIPMGSMHITGRSQSYMDYSPYCKASVFLPYCGTYALDVDDIMDADVELEYHVDIYTGACVAYLTITRTNADGSSVHDVMYQFTGNMLATIPITGQDHRQFLQSLLFMGASIAATVATAGSAAPAIEGAAAAGDAVAISPALTGVAAGSAINTVMSMKPNVMRSGNLSSNAGMLGKQTPTITMTWSNLCRPETEYEQVGMPIYKSGTLSDFEGFTVVNSVHMENIYCTETERDMIAQALAKGVIV